MGIEPYFTKKELANGTTISQSRKVKITCPNCGKVWIGTLRTYYTCSDKYAERGGCGCSFNVQKGSWERPFITKQGDPAKRKGGLQDGNTTKR